MRKLRHLIYLILLIGFDQFTKYLVIQNLQDSPFILIPKIFQFTYHENDGAVWGILSGRTIFLVLMAVILLSFMVFIYIKVPAEKRYNALHIILIFICAGAVGNLLDRILKGYVVDFLYFELIDFPIFNVADCYITISSVLLVLLGLFYYKDEDFAFLSFKSDKAVTATVHDAGEKAVVNDNTEDSQAEEKEEDQIQ
ncbi:signal peptidase II [Anaerocolumna sp. AGMB13020]|uniref:signal peptidase II n=1 Tax=Anaerocolumna sp. AGMB13020 TaxID=3081750 RepID=UPI00295528C4|nr:signal peptidase II [Anaerocolumna sp. AGMB13020]WOO36982.1 signal peptidase II [Anaerocolumna sp. AGMB13020]